MKCEILFQMLTNQINLSNNSILSILELMLVLGWHAVSFHLDRISFGWSNMECSWCFISDWDHWSLSLHRSLWKSWLVLVNRWDWWFHHHFLWWSESWCRQWWRWWWKCFYFWVWVWIWALLCLLSREVYLLFIFLKEASYPSL